MEGKNRQGQGDNEMMEEFHRSGIWDWSMMLSGGGWLLSEMERKDRHCMAAPQS
jgi:hypothetical protein